LPSQLPRIKEAAALPRSRSDVRCGKMLESVPRRKSSTTCSRSWLRVLNNYPGWDSWDFGRRAEDGGLASRVSKFRDETNRLGQTAIWTFQHENVARSARSLADHDLGCHFAAGHLPDSSSSGFPMRAGRLAITAAARFVKRLHGCQAKNTTTSRTAEFRCGRNLLPPAITCNDTVSA
jgi:hypothetical protein